MLLTLKFATINTFWQTWNVLDSIGLHYLSHLTDESQNFCCHQRQSFIKSKFKQIYITSVPIDYDGQKYIILPSKIYFIIEMVKWFKFFVVFTVLSYAPCGQPYLNP